METTQQPVAIVTRASSEFGLGITQAMLERGWRVVGTSRTISQSKDLKPRRSTQRERTRTSVGPVEVANRSPMIKDANER